MEPFNIGRQSAAFDSALLSYVWALGPRMHPHQSPSSSLPAGIKGVHIGMVIMRQKKAAIILFRKNRVRDSSGLMIQLYHAKSKIHSHHVTRRGRGMKVSYCTNSASAEAGAEAVVRVSSDSSSSRKSCFTGALSGSNSTALVSCMLRFRFLALFAALLFRVMG